MNKFRTNRGLLAGAILSLLVNVPAVADDTEIYVGGNLTSTAVPPNILFVVDTSGSMGSTVTTQGSYDASVDYSGLATSCSEFTNDRVYWSTGSVSTSCGSARWFETQYLQCASAEPSLFDAANGGANATGFYQDRAARYHNNRWRNLTTNSSRKNRNVECESDSGVHGNGGAATYAADSSGNNTTGGWSTNQSNEINWSLEGNYTLYSANFMNYLRSDPTAIKTRLQVVQEVVADVVSSVNNINIGLMRFSTDQEGGMVSYAMEDIATGRNGFVAAVNSFTPSGPTPLTEVLWEAMRYFRGDGVDYGMSSVPTLSVPTSQTGGNYISPIEFQCQRNNVILLTDGASNGDNGRDAQLQGMTNFATATGAANCPHPSEHVSADGDSDDGQCLDQLAAYMANEDQLPTQLIGDQYVQTYTIGFQLDHQLLRSTAQEGEGLYFTADDTAGLTNAFTAIINEVLASNTTFTSPAVSVNAFSQTTHRNELYFTLFRPGGGPHWDGNLKKYRLEFRTDANGESFPLIEDVNGNDAVDSVSGFFRDTARSWWSAATDGDDVADGGAAGELTNNRNVYTYTAPGMPNNASLASATNALHESNALITDVMLDMTPGATNPSRDDILRWARGIDIDGDFGTPGGDRMQMGDPLHSQASVVQYGGTEAAPDLTIFFSTNDGYLHAVDEGDGSEVFSFVPRELLPNLAVLYENNASYARPYGLDGSVVTWVNDVSGDGIIAGSDEHVYVYVGMRRGGSSYYALDVTNRAAPVLKWMITNDTDGDGTPDGDFAELGQSWSQPVVRKILFGGIERDVLIFGGGYDADQDGNTLPTDDAEGRAIYVVDADTGQRLWWAGPVGSGAPLELTNLTNSVPGRINALDLTGNGIVDRMYFGDTRAQVWRVDVNESNTSAADFATGGRIALLSENTAEDNRRIYEGFDVAAIAPPGRQPYLAIVFGTGYRAHPLDTTIRDRIYMLKDTHIFGPPPSYVTLTETDLFDATDNTIGEGVAADQQQARSDLNAASGWYIVLQDPPTGDFVGEKVLGRPLIISGFAIVPSFIPSDPTAGGPVCGPNEGVGLLYFLNVGDATPVGNYDTVGNDTDLTRSDRVHRLARGGITPSPTLIIAQDAAGNVHNTSCAGTECIELPDTNHPRKTYWFEN